jgi:signal transduction histidine kinase
MKLKQILHNLINNGIKFTDQGSVTVSAKMEDGGEKVAFAVSDTGIGMSQPVQQIIFNKFYQLDSSETRRYGGVGLGLHMAKTLTELLGGNIKVESTPGEGSTFTVSIPRAV